MVLTDYRGFKIELSDEALEHIRKGHAEITVAVIAETMATPDEVRKSTQVKPSSRRSFITGANQSRRAASAGMWLW